MRSIPVSGIIAAVRYRLNEELVDESLALEGAGAYGDDADIDAVVRSHIPEALDYVHTAARADGLDGLSATDGEDYDKEISGDGVIDIRMRVKVLRLLSLRATDTPFNVREAVSEGSAEGHKQLKPYTRGTWDRPALVARADSADYEPHLVYYSLRDAGADGNGIEELIYIPKQYAPDDNDEYLVSSLLEEGFYDYLTSLVLDTYGEHERAQIYAQRSVAPTN